MVFTFSFFVIFVILFTILINRGSSIPENVFECPIRGCNYSLTSDEVTYLRIAIVDHYELHCKLDDKHVV